MGLFSFQQELAIDLGTANTIIIHNDKVVVNEPSIVAIDQHTGKLVAIGEVGLILSREVSRLSRTDKDWFQLLEVCQLFGTLIGDAERVYDLSSMDDQLVLGIKGTLSVVELKVLNLRLQQGMEEKARRGELVRLLPPGYIRDGAGTVVKDPDRRVQALIRQLARRTSANSVS